jgi:SAM-dependent methyltransferase
MNINWKLKSFIFGFIDFLHAKYILFFIQRFITKSSIKKIIKIDYDWVIHQKNLSSFHVNNLLEFGAGKSLAQNLYLSQFIANQTVVDLNKMLDFDLLNSASSNIAKLTENFKYIECKNINELQKNYGVNYLAPFHFERNTLEFNSFDACISTNTLEHIPITQLEVIFYQLKNILKNGGVLSMIIDYVDHYSYTDKNLNKFNFLKYSFKSFCKYNHNSHFQNQLRHYDYVNLFLRLGYEVIISDYEDVSMIPEKISSDFNALDPSIGASKGIFLLRVNK